MMSCINESSCKIAALLALIILVCGCVSVDAVCLTISGHSSGQGAQNLTFTGDFLSVNMSTQNGTSWNITAEGLV